MMNVLCLVMFPDRASQRLLQIATTASAYFMPIGAAAIALAYH